EVAAALALGPSYIAIGPIFATSSKQVDMRPQGVVALRRWRRSLKYPLVAIGGINLQNAKEVLAAGADGIAVMRGVASQADSDVSVNAWLNLFTQELTASKSVSATARGRF